MNVGSGSLEGRRHGRPNICLVVASYSPNFGGLQRTTSMLAVALQARGHEVEVLTQRYPRSLPASEVIDGVPVRRLLFLTPRLRSLLAGRIDLFLAGLVLFPVTLVRMVWYIRRRGPDVVNLHFVGDPTLFVLLARLLCRFRLIVSLHGDDVEGLGRGTWFDRRLFRMALSRANAVTACSAYLLRQATRLVPAIKRKGRVICNGVDVSANPPSLAPGPTLLAVGRMVPAKGFDLLLHALAALPYSGAPPTLALIGDGPERAALEALATRLGVADRVAFPGRKDAAGVAAAIAACQVLVAPSRQEAFGIVALEAMAAGKPVVATRVGGLPELLAGAASIMIPPGDVGALVAGLSDALERVMAEPAFGGTNREHARQFSVALMADRFSALYQDTSHEG